MTLIAGFEDLTEAFNAARAARGLPPLEVSRVIRVQVGMRAGCGCSVVEVTLKGFAIRHQAGTCTYRLRGNLSEEIQHVGDGMHNAVGSLWEHPTVFPMTEPECGLFPHEQAAEDALAGKFGQSRQEVSMDKKTAGHAGTSDTPTEPAARALRIVQEHGAITPGFFADYMWPESEGHIRRVSNVGRGATRGVGHWRAAGAYLSRLTKRGWLSRRYRPGMKAREYFITAAGCAALQAHEAARGKPQG